MIALTLHTERLVLRPAIAAKPEGLACAVCRFDRAAQVAA